MKRHMTLDMKGDGRKLIYPNEEIGVDHIGLGKPVKLSAARKIVNNFLHTKYSIHSKAGSYMWVIHEFCHIHHLPCIGSLNHLGGHFKLMDFK